MVEYKFISENTIEYLSLHDCQCSRLYYADSALIFEMEWMEVLATHPNNPFDKSYQSTEGKIILLNPIVEIGILHTDDSQRDESMNRIEDVDISDFEHDSYILKEYQNPTNALQYFKNMIQISCGDIEDHMFVVKNTCTNKDYEIDMNRLEEIYQLLMTHIKRR